MAWGFLKRGAVPYSGETSAKALALALKAPSVSGRAAVLDLGSANESNLNFYSKIAKKISFEDLSARLDSEANNVNVAELIPGNTQYDTVICWDVFNYLDPIQAEMLVAKIRSAAVHGTRVVVSVINRPQMAEAPSNFKIIEEGKIICEPRTDKMKTSPRHSPRAIHRWFAGFEVIYSCIHRYGAEEYVFQYRGQESGQSQEASRAA
jgi:hypothetical protein